MARSSATCRQDFISRTTRDVGGFIEAIETTEVAAERRAAAPHPGPILKREYFDVLGVDEAAVAAQLGLDAARFGDMLAGRLSIDVDAAVRIARAIQLPAERIMLMQVQCDFAAVRQARRLDVVAVLRPTRPQSFPSVFIPGRLGSASDDLQGQASYFFKQTLERPIVGDAYAGLHALWRGDRLRIYDTAGAVLWVGPILHDLDGHVLLPFVSATDWRAWFGAALRADLAFGVEHAAFFAKMHDA